MEKIALVIDAQNDFMTPNGALYVPGADNILDTLNEYLSSIRIENGYYGIIFTADTHEKDEYQASEEAKLFPPHCIKGSEGFNFAVDMTKLPTLESIRNERVQELIKTGKTEDQATEIARDEKIIVPERLIMNKGVFNMWEESNLSVRPYRLSGELVAHGGAQDRDALFTNLKNIGVDQVEVVGVASDYCVKDAIHGLLIRGFTVTVYDNLVAGIERDIYQVAEEEFNYYFQNGQLIIE